MDIDEFRDLHRRYAQAKPKLFALVTPDDPATVGQLEAVEREIGITLPSCLRDFLAEFGGGTFGLINIFSASPESEFYLPEKCAEAADYLPPGLLPFSDDYAGGLYVFKVHAGHADDRVFYWNADGGLVATQFENLLQFIARYAYESDL